MKRAFVTPLAQQCPDCRQDLDNEEPYFVAGFVWPSADGGLWEVELTDLTFKGKHLPLSALSKEQAQRAEDLLVDLANRAEQELAYGG